MTPADALSLLSRSEPPPGATPGMMALWHEMRGDWGAAHHCVTAASDADGMWVHAYLHRREGDLGNARYWYARAKKPPCEGSLDAERAEIAVALLAKGAGA
jgi:hypothetical protein